MTRIKIVTLFLSIIFSSAITTVSAVENDSIAVNDSISIVDIINNNFPDVGNYVGDKSNIGL